MFIYKAVVLNESSRITSLQEIVHNERRSIEDYLSDMSGIVSRSYSYILHGYKTENKEINLYFSAANIKQAVIIAEKLAPLHRR